MSRKADAKVATKKGGHSPLYTDIKAVDIVYERRVIHTPTTRLLSLGRIIPKDWQYVRIVVLYKGEDYRMLELEKMELTPSRAHIAQTHKAGEQDT